jgi:hypothetical protein
MGNVKKAKAWTAAEIDRNDKILKKFEEDYDDLNKHWGPIHEEYNKDKRFVFLDEQWDPDVEAARKANALGSAPRITLTVNRTHQHIMQVANEIKRSEMGIKVRPKDDGTDKVIAEVRQGIIRSIERNSGGIQCYAQAVLDQVAAGLGAWRIVTEYGDEKTFDQDIVFRNVPDASMILMDPDCIKEDYSDAARCIVRERYSKARFKSEFKKDPDDVLFGNTKAAWGNADSPNVCEYFYKEETAEELVKGIDGNTYYLSDAKAEAKAQGVEVEDFLAKGEDGELITRETTRCKIMWAKLAGKEVLSVQEWPGYWIPVFLIHGRKTIVDGKVRIEGLTRRAKPAQQAYNYVRSASVERIAYGTKAPHMVPEGGIPESKNEQFKWNTSNSRPWNYLTYKVYDSMNRPIPPPHRTEMIGADPALMNETGQSIDDHKAALGMYDNSLGKTGPAQSGRAVIALQQQGDTATYDFGYNASIGVRHCGRVLNEVIPKIYDTPRQIRMVGEDEKEKVVWVNKQAKNKDTGEDYYYDLNTGKFDLEVEMGPSQATKRMETSESMQALMQSSPSAAEIMVGDYVRAQDWRGAEKAAEKFDRFLAMKYPGLEDSKDGQDPKAAQMQQQMQDMQQQAQQQMETFRLTNKRIKSKCSTLKPSV